MPEAAVDVAGPETLVVPVVEPGRAERQVAARLDLGLVGDLLVGEHAGPGHELVRRAGRVVGLDRVVGQRLVGVVEQLLVGGVADAPCEDVVVVGRQAHQREDLAGLRVHGDHDAALDPDLLHRPFQGLLGVLLLVRVDREGERVARSGLRDGLEDLHLPAGPIDARRSGCRRSRAAPSRIAASMPRPCRAGRPGGSPSSFRVLSCSPETGPVYPRSWDISGPSVYCRRASTSTSTPGRSTVGLGDEACRLLVDVAGDPDEVEGRARVPVDRGVDVGGGHAEQRGQSIDDDGPLVDRQVRGPQLDDERRDVRDERAAVPVVDQPARRLDGLEDGPILRGERRQAATVDDLEVEQARRQAADGEDDDEAEGEEARQRSDGLRAVVEEGRHQSIRSTSARRSWIEMTSGPIRAARTVS